MGARLWWACGLLLSSCTRPAALPPLDGWLVSGCTAVLADRVCEAPAGQTLRAFLPVARSATILGTLGGAALGLDRSERALGYLVRFRVPAQGGQVAFEARTGTVSAAFGFELRTVTSSVPEAPERMAWHRRFEDARRALRAGEFSAAVEELEAVATGSRELEPTLSLVATVLRAQLLAYQLGDPEGGLRAVAQVPQPGPLFGEGRLDLAYHRAVVYEAAGQVRDSARAYDAAAVLAEALDSPMHLLVEQGRALSLVALGRAAEGAQLIEALIPKAVDSPPCWRADLYLNAAWAEIEAQEAGARPLERLAQAMQLYQGACESELDANNVRVNLALLEEQRGALDRAAARLAEVRGSEYPAPRLWRRALEARLALARGQLGEARRELEGLAGEAELASLEAVVWQARTGLGRLEAQARRFLEAAAAYESAEDALDRYAAMAPVDRGRFAYAEDRSASADGLIEVRLALSDPAGAFLAARRARRRGIRALAARDGVARLDPKAQAEWAGRLGRYQRTRLEADRALEALWKAPSEEMSRAQAELAERSRRVKAALEEVLALLGPTHAEEQLAGPAPGELILLPRPRPGTGLWQAFAADEARVKSAVLPDLSTASWVAAFGPQLRAARQITVFAAGNPLGLDLHRARLGGRPLIADRAVVYGLDLPRRPSSTAGRRALVIGDPRGDLPSARLEAQAVGRTLEQAGWQVRRLDGAAARSSLVLEALSQADLLHYAGHASYAGPEGGDSALLLADRGLGVGELLLAPQVPKEVVLTACESGKSTPWVRTAGLGLAQAFVAAGAAAVVATGAEVPDRAAALFSERLYRAQASGGGLAAAYRAAVLPGLEEGHPPDFQLLVP